MTRERLDMRKIREVIRLKYTTTASQREIGRHCGIARSTVRDYLYRAGKAGITWPLPQDLDDAGLERLLFANERRKERGRPLPDWAETHQELKRPHVTLFLLWDEYKGLYPDGYQYSRFCDLYRQWLGKCDVVMRQEHRAGEKLFVDYAGHTISVVDRLTGAVTDAQVFVAVLGASNYTYAEATASQSLKDWIGSHVRAFRFFGGAVEILVPDNLRSAVTKAHRYEPLLNSTYRECAEYYGVCIIPARVRKPKDKAKAEGGVLLVERWILARLRNRQYFSLHDLNADITELLEILNQRPFKKLSGSRASLFEALDKPALKPLPAQPYQFAQWSKARVHPNCHIEVNRHHYSVPHALVKQQLDVRLTEHTVEAFHKGNRVASHKRNDRAHNYTTTKEHLPRRHREYGDWSPERFSGWAAKVGVNTYKLIRTLLEGRAHPQQAYKSCFGVMSLSKKYGDQRLEAACCRAIALGSHSYRSLESILKHGLDHQPLPEAPTTTETLEHPNVRGASYYNDKA